MFSVFSCVSIYKYGFSGENFQIVAFFGPFGEVDDFLGLLPSFFLGCFGMTLLIFLFLAYHIYCQGFFKFDTIMFYFRKPFVSQWPFEEKCVHQKPTRVSMFYFNLFHPIGLSLLLWALLHTSLVAPIVFGSTTPYEDFLSILEYVFVLP